MSVAGARVDQLGERMPDGPVTALVRPEDIAFAAAGLPATVVASSFLGSLRRTQVRLDDGVLVAVQHDVADRFDVGAQVFLKLKGAAVSVSPR